MSKKTKAIIITRTNAYIDANNAVKKDREEFGKAIIKEKEGESSYSVGKYCLKKLLKAKRLIETGDYDKPPFKITVPEEFEFDPEKGEEYIYNQLVKHKDLLDDELKSSKCYVLFTPKEADHEKEVILVLWDQLSDNPGEKVDDVNLFIQSIIDDCGINECNDDIENVLYIHDKQIFSDVSDYNDAVIWDESGLKETDFRGVYDSFRNYFVYVASFGHASGSAIFNQGILKFKFGPTAAEKIGVIESEAISFLDLRNRAEEILENEIQ